MKTINHITKAQSCRCYFSLILGIVCTVWIFCGGVRDAFRLFRVLKAERIDNPDAKGISERNDLCE